MNTEPKKTVLQLFSCALITFAVAACSSTGELKNPTTNATLWMQNSAEYKAVTMSIYQMALSNLDPAREDSNWTAYPRQEEKDYSKLPPAIMLDLDETVLNNAAFQARMIKQNKNFSLESWNKWVREAQADAVAGAVEFTKEAARNGVSVFYFTNREARVEESTRKNLQKLGFPLSIKEDRILSQNEKPDWNSSKTARKAFVASKYRIIMFFGDDLNDFVPAKNITLDNRSQLVKNNREMWAQKWYILPNPVYGSWEPALYNFNTSLSKSKMDSAKTSKLDTKSN